MRLWTFDRLGGISSEPFDINKDGRWFVFTILGFLWLNEEELGKERFIEIKRNGAEERRSGLSLTR